MPLNRIEHFTAALAEERRKDREEYKALWRDTQRQLNELSTKLNDLSTTVLNIADEAREADRRLEARIAQLGEETRIADQQLRDRIDSLVSAIGRLIPQPPPQP